jgi:hypothetical protein
MVMKRALLCFLLIVCVAVSAQGQDFKKVVDIVVEMEASLKDMIAKEESQRKTEVASLKSEVQNLRTTLVENSPANVPAQPVVTTASADVLQRVESLEKKVGDLKPSHDVTVFAGQLSTLVTELKKTIDDEKLTQANAAKPASPPPGSVQVGGQVFAYYAYTTTGIEGKGYNRFDLDRLYLTAKAQIFDEGKVQLTTDIFRNTATGTYYPGLSIRIKLGYFDYTPFSSLSVKIGVIPTVWCGFMDSYWKYRGIAPTVTDRNSFFSSADIGLSISYALPEKLGEIAGFMLNGNGYAAPETNRFKDFGFRVSVSPFTDSPTLKSFVLAGYAYKGNNMSALSTALQRDRLGAFVGYSYDVASAGVEYSIRKEAPTNPDTVVNGNALSLFGEFKAPFEEVRNKLSFVWRYDVLEPNVDKGLDIQRFGALGICYKPHDKISFILNRQWTRAESDVLKRNDGSKTEFDGRWFLHTIVNF